MVGTIDLSKPVISRGDGFREANNYLVHQNTSTALLGMGTCSSHGTTVQFLRTMPSPSGVGEAT